MSKINWKAVLCDNNLQNRYAVDVDNRYEALSEQMTQNLQLMIDMKLLSQLMQK